MAKKKEEKVEVQADAVVEKAAPAKKSKTMAYDAMSPKQRREYDIKNR